MDPRRLHKQNNRSNQRKSVPRSLETRRSSEPQPLRETHRAIRRNVPPEIYVRLALFHPGLRPFLLSSNPSELHALFAKRPLRSPGSDVQLRRRRLQELLE